MPISQERFAQGMTYEAYKAQMTRNYDRFEANERTVEFDADDLGFFAQMPRLHVLVLAEDWCGDVIANLAVLGRLAAETGTLDLRVFPRDQNPDLMDQYLNAGVHRSIPVFAFFDDAFREIGHWIERPARMSELQEQMLRDLFANDPALAGLSFGTPPGELPEAARIRLMQALGAFREDQRALSDREVIREIRALIERGLPQQAPSVKRTPPAQVSAKDGAARQGKRPVKVSITYCASCGYEPQTLALAEALMHEFVYDLASIELIPWQDGAFDVVVAGDLVHSMYREGGFPEHAAIIAAVRERLAVA